MSSDNFRQLLSRARRDLSRFMNGQCGLVNEKNPCRCPKKTRGFIAAGHVDPRRLRFVPEQVERIRDVAPERFREIDDAFSARHAAVYGDHPFLRPTDQVAWIRGLLQREEIRAALNLN
jgi:hypothetical protein